MFIILGLLVILFVFVFSKISTLHGAQKSRSRVSQISSTCNNRMQTIFIIVNLSEEDDLPYLANNCFQSCDCPQRVFIGAAVGEQVASSYRNRLESLLVSSSQPQRLSENTRVCTAYTRQDRLQQTFDELYQQEDLVMVLQGKPVFQPGFDRVLDNLFAQKPNLIFSQFCPANAHQTAGFPCVKSLSKKHKKARVAIQHFKKKNERLVSLLFPSHQLFVAPRTFVSHLNFLKFSTDYLLDELANAQIDINSISLPLVLLPHTDAFSHQGYWLPIPACAVTNGEANMIRWRYGLSHNVTEDEAINKFGSLRRYNDLVASLVQNGNQRTRNDA